MKHSSLRRTRAARLAVKTGVSESWIFAILAETDKHELTRDTVLALLGAKRRGEIPDHMTPQQVVAAVVRRLAAATQALTTGELEGALDGPGVRLRQLATPPREVVDIGPCAAEVFAPVEGHVPLVVLRPLEHCVVPAEAWAAGAVSFRVPPGEVADLIAANACRIRVDTPDGEYALDAEDLR